MGIFGKKPQVDDDVHADEQPAAPPRPAAAPAAAPTQAAKPAPAAAPTPAAAAAPAPAALSAKLFDGPRVDIDAIYKSAKLSAEELDRVSRAEQLLHLLPSNASGTREVVDATFRAFGVDRAKILDASSKQLHALESFIRYSHEQTQLTIDANAKQIAELEAQIARCRQVSAKATNEGEERARGVNEVLVKVQRVLDFFGDQHKAADLDRTGVMKPATEKTEKKPTEPPPLPGVSPRTGTP